jgi:type I restriction enzyme S subunit
VSWKTVELGTVCDLQNGFAFKSNLFSADGLPILRISNIKNQRIDTNNLVFFKRESYKEKIEQYKVKPNDLLIAMSGATTGKIGFNNTNETFYLNQRVGNLKPRENLDKKYLYYFLSTQVENNLSISAGAAQPNLSTEQIKGMKIPLPSLSTQQKLVDKLDAIFAEIDKATAAAEANAKNSERLYSSAVDTFFENLNDKFVKLSACADIGYGYTSKSSVEFDGPQYLRITDIQDDNVDWLLVPRIQDTEVEVKKFLLKDGDIVFARTGATTGKSFLLAEPPISVFASYLIRVDADRSLIVPEYLRHFFRSEGYWNAINAGISGAAQGGFNASKLGELAFPLPTLDKQRKIVAKLTAIEMLAISAKKSFEIKVKLFELLKNSILKKAFAGELVKE